MEKYRSQLLYLPLKSFLLQSRSDLLQTRTQNRGKQTVRNYHWILLSCNSISSCRSVRCHGKFRNVQRNEKEHGEATSQRHGYFPLGASSQEKSSKWDKQNPMQNFEVLDIIKRWSYDQSDHQASNSASLASPSMDGSRVRTPQGRPARRQRHRASLLYAWTSTYFGEQIPSDDVQYQTKLSPVHRRIAYPADIGANMLLAEWAGNRDKSLHRCRVHRDDLLLPPWQQAWNTPWAAEGESSSCQKLYLRAD